MKRLLLFVAISMVWSVNSNAQQLGRFSQYMFESYLVNPAVAGTKLYSPITATYRNQWAGFEGAPKTFTMSAHTPLPNNLGAGIIIMSDNTGGAISSTQAEVTASYKVDLNNVDAFSFGLSALATQYSFDNSKLNVYDKQDEVLLAGSESTFLFDAGFGMMLYGNDYHIGMAIPHLFQADLDIRSAGTSNSNKWFRHYIFHGDYAYDINKDWTIEPSALLRLTAATPVQVDVNAKVRYMDFIWAGVSYRHADAVVLMTGVEYNGIVFGYAYDMTVSNARAFSPHTHEIMLGYRIARSGSFASKSRLGNRRLDKGRLVK